MGVDYDAEYGVGYEVEAGECVADEELEDGLGEFIYGNCGDGFSHFEVGEGAYTGDGNTYYVTIDKPFDGGLNLAEKKNALDEELKRLRLSPVGEFGLVGGLHVW